MLAALRLDAGRLPLPRTDGDREALRILHGTRHELTVVTTAQTNRLRTLLLGGGDTERDLARATLIDPVLLAMARRWEPPQASCEQAVRRGEIRRLAHAIRAGRHALAASPQLKPSCLSPTLDGAEATPRSRCRAPAHCRPAAARRFGIGSTAGGDRALNRAIHTIAVTRMRCCPTTQNYVARRTAEGKSSREIQRCLKRYIVRELYRALNASTALTAQTPAAPAAA